MDDKLKNNRLSDDDLDKVNGGFEILSEESEYGEMVLSGICPKCFLNSNGRNNGFICPSVTNHYICKECRGSFLIYN